LKDMALKAKKYFEQKSYFKRVTTAFRVLKTAAEEG